LTNVYIKNITTKYFAIYFKVIFLPAADLAPIRNVIGWIFNSSSPGIRQSKSLGEK